MSSTRRSNITIRREKDDDYRKREEMSSQMSIQCNNLNLDSVPVVEADMMDGESNTTVAMQSLKDQQEAHSTGHFSVYTEATESNNVGESASSQALADALSSSLASIAAAESSRKLWAAAEAATAEDDVRSNNSSEEGPSSTTSSGLQASGDSGPAVVTMATATTSSGGDELDRDSSGGNGGGSNNSSAENKFAGRHQRHHNIHVHHPHHHRPSGSVLRQEQLTTSSGSSSDGYGLPVPVDVRLQQLETHTKVVARLPPPHTDSSGAENDNVDPNRYVTGSLLAPHREPGFQTIRRTFDRFGGRDRGEPKSSETDSSGADHPAPSAMSKHKHKSAAKRSQPAPPKKIKNSKSKKRPRRSRGSDNDDAGGNGSSSGSGTEGGYAGSASSNENGAQGGSSSPSVSSSEESVGIRKPRVKGVSTSTSDPNRPMLSKKQDSSLSVSSDIADFSSGSSGEAAGSFASAFRQSSSRSPSITSSSDEQDESSVGQKLARKVHNQSSQRNSHAWPPLSLQVSETTTSQAVTVAKPVTKGRVKPDKNVAGPLLEGKAPILAVGCDVMAHILTFLEPPDILDVLTMPLSKDWLVTFTRQTELWRVLCLLEPFKAQVENNITDSSDESVDSYCPIAVETELRRTFGKFRLLYTSFVRCMRYLSRIQDDALHGRPPSVIDYGATQTKHSISANQNLQQFLARARGFLVNARNQPPENSDISDDDNVAVEPVARAVAVGISDEGSCGKDAKRKRAVMMDTKPKDSKKKKRVRYGHSIITQRLLSPTASGETGHVELPWSCAIYSIVNWMVAFADVEGIQTMCLKVLPFILEDEQQRITAQRAGLTDVVLRGMVMFPESAALHTSAFHTIVLLARPLGGREGMLFHSSMVNSSGIFSSDGGSQTGRTGIAVMLDSMRRFQSDEVLQAMSCWSLVNIALAPSQKEMLVGLGGIQVTANAMMEHPFNAEVQFRALFALINLVIPSVSLGPTNQGENGNAGGLPVAECSEKEMLDEMVDQIVSLVVASMKNFCASEAILNRACLVLHNLSLTQEYHGPLLWTPHCYQMLEWCLANYPADQVLQQSAAGTLHRLQISLSSDDSLRARFAASLQSQQQLSLEEAHREAVLLQEAEENRGGSNDNEATVL